MPYPTAFHPSVNASWLFQPKSTRLRQLLGQIENPLGILSASGRSALDALGQVHLPTEMFDLSLHSLLPTELKALNGYLRQRQAALHSATRSLLAGTLVKIQESRPMEIIRLLDWTPGLFKSKTSEDEEEEIQ